VILVLAHVYCESLFYLFNVRDRDGEGEEKIKAVSFMYFYYWRMVSLFY
jgi:hypothetical protein